jgi:hypothetical protein
MNNSEWIKYNCLIDMEIATREEIHLVRNCMTGSWDEVLNAILYARTGYNSIEQMMEDEEEE